MKGYIREVKGRAGYYELVVEDDRDPVNGKRRQIRKGYLAEPASGKGAARAYPLLRSHRTLRIDLSSGRGKRNSAQVEVELPS